MIGADIFNSKGRAICQSPYAQFVEKGEASGPPKIGDDAQEIQVIGRTGNSVKLRYDEGAAQMQFNTFTELRVNICEKDCQGSGSSMWRIRQLISAKAGQQIPMGSLFGPIRS